MHQRVGVDEFNRSSGDGDAFRIGLRKFAGSVSEQRPHAFAGTQRGVTHRGMQTLWRNVRRRQCFLQKRFDPRLPGSGPSLEVVGSQNG